MPQKSKLIIEEIPGQKELGLGWSPVLISGRLGVCIFARDDQLDDRLSMRLISRVARELEKANVDAQTFGAV